MDGVAELEISELLYCSKCFLSYSAQNGLFWLTSCGHVLCNKCFFNNEGPHDPATSELTCVYCSEHQVSIAKLGEQLPSELTPYFRPLSDLVDELSGALKFQLNSLVRLQRHQHSRLAQQMQSMAQAARELQAVRVLKAQNAQLQQENRLLRTQLDMNSRDYSNSTIPAEIPKTPSSRRAQTFRGGLAAMKDDLRIRRPSPYSDRIFTPAPKTPLPRQLHSSTTVSSVTSPFFSKTRLSPMGPPPKILQSSSAMPHAGSSMRRPMPRRR